MVGLSSPLARRELVTISFIQVSVSSIFIIHDVFWGASCSIAKPAELTSLEKFVVSREHVSAEIS